MGVGGGGVTKSISSGGDSNIFLTTSTIVSLLFLNSLMNEYISENRPIWSWI